MGSMVMYIDDTLIIFMRHSYIQPHAYFSAGSESDNPVILVQLIVVLVMLQFAYIARGLTHKFSFQNVLRLLPCVEKTSTHRTQLPSKT